MNNKMFKLAALMVLSYLILASPIACRSEATENPVKTANVVPVQATGTSPVKTANVKSSDIVPHFTAEGRLSVVEYRNLTFRTIGNVGQINVSELDRVTKGQVLAKLDTKSLEQSLKTAELVVSISEIALKSAQTDLEQAKDNLRKITYPYTYNTVYIDVPQALGLVNDATLEINKATESLSTKAYDEVSYQLKQALDTLTQSQQILSRHGYGEDVFANKYLSMDKFWSLRTAEFQRDKAQLAVDKATNDLDRAKNDLDRARDELDKAIITAPFDGIIADVNVKVGDVLSAVNYTAPAIVLIDPGRMELNVKVNELDIPKVKLGQKAAITVDALPDEQFGGVVTSISLLPEVAGSAVSYEVKIALDMPQNLALRAGMRATADFIAG